MPHRPTPTSIIAVLALLVAFGGSAVAASHYIITSTTQIKPNVLRYLRGHTGARGQTGPSGETGEAGKEGSPGTEGGQGPSGTSETNVAARARSVAAVTSTTGTPTPDPLKSGVWTQGAEELDQLAIQIEVTSPSEASCTQNAEGNSIPPVGRATIEVDGKAQTEIDLPVSESETTDTVQGSSWLFEPAKSTSHTLTAAVSDRCGVGGGNSGGHFKIDSISIDVLAAH
jgi:hypothetical protein